MEPKNFFTFTTLLHKCTIFIMITIFTTLANHGRALDRQYEACVPRTCGNRLNISYPFWISQEQESFCGYPNFEITCKDEEPVLRISNEDYIIKDFFYGNNSLLVASAAVYEETCPTPLHNLSLSRTPFNLKSTKADLFFWYNCTKKPPDYYTYPIDCASNATHYSFAGFHEEILVKANYSIDSCQDSVYVPVDVDTTDVGNLLQMNYTEILKTGFFLNWTAHNCSSCEASKRRSVKTKVIIGLSVGFGVMFIMAVVFFIILYRYRKKYAPSPYVSRNISSDPSSVAELEKADKILGVQVFSYTELEEATNHFDSAEELGDGGFGTVYYGKLQDGRAVAVKRLYENNYKRVEQFKNEVEILAHLRHTNLVTLYGCTSRHSRELLLVYEYISNGTVADHLHGELTKPGALPWATRLDIAIETACALKYLHASDIIHRDVKTNNILLDNNFCVKVADFGLSRLFPTNVTHISTAPQGTPGYLDPEYHQCYQLTDKSDVFSFGVVLVELISSMPAVDITRHRHEINLSNLAINKIQNKALHELVDPSLGFESDYKVRKMIYSVAELAFQCLQSDKDLRPSMTTVLDTLKDIQSDGYSNEKAEELDITDDVGLLKHGPPTPSPDSRTSRKTTPPSSN
ncbi:hypothetical protein LWI29_002835 [Acer saccharum]|uniref:non-specific serine/threonine protein kinase n=1 Tax=Acer saccharum TaxID=4024 RepID=A0AA39S652_ACESA|nr:hypothetical protein LWI29_002835 [Acer saccharum]